MSDEVKTLKIHVNVPVMGLTPGSDYQYADSPFLRKVIANGYVSLVEDETHEATPKSDERTERIAKLAGRKGL